MRTLTLFTALLAMTVVMLGAYTRLSDAGLGCPDWPGCYGHIGVPTETIDVIKAEHSFQQPVEAAKAWKEMIHRYLAGTLSLCILVLTLLGIRRYYTHGRWIKLPLALAGLVVFQALLGMWTVTLKLKPVIVLLHLLGGLSLLSLLWWLFLSLREQPFTKHRLQPWAILGVALLGAQILLGGWTSANYAALICPDLPYCQGQLLPSIDFHAFNPLKDLHSNNATLISIHMAHRLGAMIVGFYLATLSLWLIFWTKLPALRTNGLAIALLLITQVSLGILNVVWLLPLSTAVTHNVVAALLLLSLLTLVRQTTQSKRLTHD